MAHLTRSGWWIPEKPHTPPEGEEVECKDCFESVADADEDYCRGCGDPLCEECQNVVAENHCVRNALPLGRKRPFPVYRICLAGKRSNPRVPRGGRFFAPRRLSIGVMDPTTTRATAYI